MLKAGRHLTRQVPRPTSFGKWGGGPMVLKVGNFSSQACTDQNSCGIGNCGTDLDFRTSQLAPCIAELRFHPPSAELELNLSRPPCAPRAPPVRPPCAPGAPPVRPRPSISLQHWNHICHRSELILGAHWVRTGDIWNAQWIKTNQYGLASYQTSKLITHFIIYCGEKWKECNRCGYAFSCGSHLRRHLKTHSGEKSNKCNQCNYASPHAFTLRIHLKTHTGEKSNKCNECDYASSHPSHLKIHSGEKSY